MKTPTLLTLTALLTLLAACGQSRGRQASPAAADAMGSEEVWCQRDSNRIYGILYRPQHADGRLPLVIVSHGFGGDNAFGWIYGEALAARGCMCYSFDFCGGGNHSRSDGRTTDMSIFSERADLEAVIAQLKARPDVDTTRISLIGESQGGMVSALTASAHATDVASLILIYPALCIPDDARTRFASLADVPAESDMWGVRLGRAYYEGLYELDPYAAIAGYTGPVLLLHGDHDKIVNIAYSERAAQTYADVDYHVMEGAGHGFNDRERAQAIAYVVDFLDRRVGGLTAPAEQP